MVTEIDKSIDFLEDLSDSIDYSVVGPQDNRVHEIRTRQFPFNTLCHIERDFGDGRWRGCSGALIDPLTVLTAAHCLYNYRLRRAPVRIRIQPGRSDRDTLPYGSTISSHYYAPRKYINARQASNPDRKDYDYGIILLPRAFPGITRLMQLRSLTNSEMEKTRHARLITIAGYPADRPIGTLWRHTERLHRALPRRLLYTVDTCPGHSGSPIWYQNGQKRYIIGIHTSGMLDELGRPYGCLRGTVLAPAGLMNSGVRITPEVLSDIRNPDRRAGAGGTMQRLP